MNHNIVKKYIQYAIWCLATTCVASIGHANQLPTALDARKLLSQADLVVLGTVRRVYFESIHSGKYQDTPGGLATTMVEFEPKVTYLGDIGERTMIYLRFAGGVNDRGYSMISDNLPIFKVGDMDLMAIVDNGKSPCPLVGCKQGRFRIIEDKLYAHDGREILFNDKTNQVYFGKHRNLKTINEFNLGKFEYRIEESYARVGYTEEAPDDSMRLMTTENYARALRAVIGSLEPSGQTSGSVLDARKVMFTLP